MDKLKQKINEWKKFLENLGYDDTEEDLINNLIHYIDKEMENDC